MGVAMQGLWKFFRAPIIKIIGYRAHRAVIFVIAWHLVLYLFLTWVELSWVECRWLLKFRKSHNPGTREFLRFPWILAFPVSVMTAKELNPAWLGIFTYFLLGLAKVSRIFDARQSCKREEAMVHPPRSLLNPPLIIINIERVTRTAVATVGRTAPWSSQFMSLAAERSP